MAEQNSSGPGSSGHRSIETPTEVATLPTDRVMVLLQSVLALEVGQQRALRKAWVALSPVVFEETGEPEIIKPVTGPSIDEEQEQRLYLESLKSWIVTLDQYPPMEKLQALEQSLEETTHPDGALLIRSHISEMRKSIPLSIEAAVVKMAYERPLYFAAGVVAILVGVYRLVASVYQFAH